MNNNTFVEAMDNFNNITSTENGFFAYKSTKNYNLDFFGSISSFMNPYYTHCNAVKLFKDAFNEDKELAIKNLFYSRDARGGQGIRNSFRYCSFELAHILTATEFKNFIKYIPEYGRWDDVFYLIIKLRNEIKECNDVILRNNLIEKNNIILKFIVSQLNEDYSNMMKGNKISIIAKWFPLENNTKNIQKKILATYLREVIFKNDAKLCRTTIVSLRKYIDVVEQKMCSNDFNKIDYEHVPSKANIKYKNSFIKHDFERYKKYIEDVNNGKKKMNVSTLYPHEIVKKCIEDNDNNPDIFNAMWDSFKSNSDDIKNSICVVDVSGSMFANYNTFSPIDVSISLGLFFADKNNGSFKNKFFTFSEKPEIVDISKCNSLYDKISKATTSNCGMNTNIENVFKLYLELAKESKMEDLPKNIIIISDMQFDDATYFMKNKSNLYTNIKNKFNCNNIPVPNLIYWNVSGNTKNFPTIDKETGTILISGFSPIIMNNVFIGKFNPEEFMFTVLNSDRYKNISIFE